MTKLGHLRVCAIILRQFECESFGTPVEKNRRIGLKEDRAGRSAQQIVGDIECTGYRKGLQVDQAGDGGKSKMHPEKSCLAGPIASRRIE